MATCVPRTPLAGRRRLITLVGILSLSLFGCGRSTPTADSPVIVPAGSLAPGECKLAVVVVFDQMRGDYLERWRDLWGEGGFRRLLADGASFSNCHYPYACTETAPGHASLATGRSPN